MAPEKKQRDNIAGGPALHQMRSVLSFVTKGKEPRKKSLWTWQEQKEFPFMSFSFLYEQWESASTKSEEEKGGRL